MIQLFRFSPSRLALSYIALSTVVLALFAIPLWYAWSVNISTFREYVHAEEAQRLADVFEREGAGGLAALIDSRAATYAPDELVVLADPSKTRIAGNLPAWPVEVPDAPGTYGLRIELADSPIRVVAVHTLLPGGYHLLMGRESARFLSLVEYFWFGIAAATVVVLVLGAIIGLLIRRALLFEVAEMNRTATAIVEGDLSRRLPTRRSEDALATLARTVNNMLGRLARQNEELAGEIAVRRDAQAALLEAHENLEQVVAQRTDALRRSEERYALAVDAAGDGHSDWIVATDEFYASPRLLEMAGLPADTSFKGRADFLRRFPFHPEDRDRVIGAINAHFGAGTVRLEMEMRICRLVETRWHHLTGLCSRDPQGALVRWNAAVTDITDRKCAEAALSLSEKRYALAIAASGEGHWDWDIVTDEFYASPRMLELYGLPPGTAFAGREDFIARIPFHPDDRPKWESAVAAHFAGETARFDIEIRMVPHGATRWIHLTGLVSRDAAGKPVRWTGSVADITERKGAEDALRLSEHRYALAMEATGDGHWDWDIATDKMYVSPLLLDMCGLPPDITFANRAEWVDRFPFYPGERPRYGRAVADHFAGKTDRVDMEIRIVPRGETRWVHMTGRCSRDASGTPMRWAGSVTDITARKRVDEELRARQDMLDLAQKAARAVAFEWRVGAGEGENRWSPDLEAMYGIEPGSYDGTYESWKKLVYPGDWPNVRAAIKSAQQSGDVAAEYRAVHRNGAIRWLQAKGRVFFDAEGKPARIVGFMLDVTDRHAAEDELRRMEQQLRQAQRLEAVGTLAGGIAHDFNNLLGAILGYGEMALRDAPAGSRLHRDLDNIMIAGERGRALVDRILAFSRSGVGERVAVHVEAVVRETLALVRAKLPGDVAIDERLHAGFAAVLGDATQIHQVLMNLVTNAVQAMPSGGSLLVSLETANVEGARVATTGSLVVGEYVLLKVADSGSGIAPEVLERIFDPFFTTKEVGVGTGLGLSLVHGIVTGLGGVIDVATTVGKGSVFSVYLPRAAGLSQPIAPARRTDPGALRGGNERILVVDDEESLVSLAAETLTGLGYAVTGFTASGAALAAFLADPEQFDAIVTDESMPGMSGAELIGKMRAIKPTIPILLVSGYVNAALVQRAMRAGAVEVLRKPLSAHQLAAGVDRLLHKAKSQRVKDIALAASAKTGTKQRSRASPSPSRARSPRR